jgi:hypothetical protein
VTNYIKYKYTFSGQLFSSQAYENTYPHSSCASI